MIPQICKRAGLSALALGIVMVVGTFVFVRVVPYPRAPFLTHPQSQVLTDVHGRPLRIVPLADGGRATWVSLGQVPPLLIAATLAGEDHRFFSHHGVDVPAMGRAVWLAVRYGRIMSGASTLTMQLGRVLSPHERTLLGKLGEVVTALRIDRAASKPEQIEQYLNRVYYGAGAVGVESAARRYFGVAAASLSPGQATLLAVLPRSPGRYDLLSHLDVALARRRHVLSLMQARGVIDAGLRARIEAEPITPLASSSPQTAGHFVDLVLSAQPARAGTRVTTIDLRLQQALEKATRAHLSRMQGGQALQAGLVVIDPRTGQVRAMVGSRAYADAQTNICTTARHPGSTLKPFIYALAIESGASPATLAHDRLASITAYHPHKTMREHGIVRYREALGGSFNLAAVDVLDRVGVSTVLQRLRVASVGNLSASAPEYGLDLALGSARTRLLDLTAAYGFLVGGGQFVRPRMFVDDPIDTRVITTPEAAWLVMDMLADPGPRRAVFGAELPLDLPFPVAAKTGTSSGFADTLTMVATQQALVGVWVGAFDGSGTRGRLAMTSAAPLARAALLILREELGSLTLPPAPPSLQSHAVCTVTGRLRGPSCPHKQERFVAAHGPTSVCEGHPHMNGMGQQGG